MSNAKYGGRTAGVFHFREAERLLAESVALPATPATNATKAQALVARAQVHAMLADAAARALTSGIPLDGPTAQEWRDLVTDTGVAS